MSPAFIADMQKVCEQIRTAVGKIGNACARIELLDPEKVTVKEFAAASMAFQSALSACRAVHAEDAGRGGEAWGAGRSSYF
ncbi:MAG: hypothetical protein ABI856_14135 [Nitrospira sp.]